MNKIRVIDLLNKIANGEELPKKIIFHGQIWDFVEDGKFNYFNAHDYKSEDGIFLFEDEWALTNNLNDEIEIIEEPKKIENIHIGYTDEAITNYKRANFNSNDMEHICRSIGFMMSYINKINDKLNEIIDYINSKEDKYE